MIELEALPNPLARQLRTGRQLAEAYRPDEEVFTTATAAFDRLLAGGLERGAMVELIGRRSSGRFSLLLSTLASTTQVGETAALIDLGDGLDPRTAADAGVELERLLWVRPRTIKEAFLSAESILKSGIPLMVFDLGLPPIAGGRGAEASWLRLARAARSHRTALLISSPYRASGTAAEAVVEARLARRHWQSRGDGPRLLVGFDTHLELLKGQRRRTATDRVTLRLAEAVPPAEGAEGAATETSPHTLPAAGTTDSTWNEPVRRRAIA